MTETLDQSPVTLVKNAKNSPEHITAVVCAAFDEVGCSVAEKGSIRMSDEYLDYTLEQLGWDSLDMVELAMALDDI